MIHLESDYNNGAHEAVLRRFMETNGERTQSYGDDCFSEQACSLIRQSCHVPKAQIWFLAGGTQTNATIIDSVLQPYEGVLCAETAHINVHESGAVEATGHKVITLPSHEGRMDAGELRAWLEAYFADDTAEHMVRPGMVYITLPTELGTLYTAAELTALHRVCREYGQLLYVDGARLAYGLAASSDVTLPLLSQEADIFYIGGTKCGALCGEAVVFPKGNAPDHMLSRIKRRGALLAKSRVVGVQFEALFSPADDKPPTPLYLDVGRHAVALAMRLRRHFTGVLGYKPYIDSPTNQQFFVIPNDDLETLRQNIDFEVWCPADDSHTVCRFVTSWATTEDEIAEIERFQVTKR
jgi:threonine aldolase